MKHYAPTLLDPWPGDLDPAVLPDRLPVRSLFPRLHSQAAAGLAWIMDTLKTVKGQEDTIFDQLYRRGHVLYGMAALLHLPKAEHTLAVLDFALDLARSLQTFERLSLGYVVSLLATTVRGILDDFLAGGRSERGLVDVIDECRTYLAEPLRQSLAPPPQPPPNLPPEPADVADAPPLAAAPAAVGGPAFDDGPEELEIPADKLG